MEKIFPIESSNIRKILFQIQIYNLLNNIWNPLKVFIVNVVNFRDDSTVLCWLGEGSIEAIWIKSIFSMIGEGSIMVLNIEAI